MKSYTLKYFLVVLLIVEYNFLFAQKTIRNAHGFTIEAEITNWPTQKVYIEYWNNDEKINDSINIFNGRFNYSGTIGTPSLIYFFAHKLDLKPIKAFYVENSKMSILGDYNYPKQWKINGSKTQISATELRNLHEPIKRQKDSLSALLNYNNGNDSIVKEQLNTFNKQYNSITIQYIRKHPTSYISLYNINNLYNIISLDSVIFLYNSLSSNIKNSYYGKSIGEKIKSMKSVAIGNIAPDFELTDTSGKVVKLNDFRGQYILIDFWASWCGPCRAENPNVKKAFNLFKEKGFTILGVSLDRQNDRRRWLQAIYSDKLTWTQVTDFKEFNSPVAKTYGIDAIPSNFLIDPHGKIIGHNLRGEKLITTLNNIFN